MDKTMLTRPPRLAGPPPVSLPVSLPAATPKLAPAVLQIGAGLLLALLVALLLALQFGAVAVAWHDWLAPFTPRQAEQPLSGGAYVLWQLRLPRVLLAVAVGAALGLGGALAQALFRNPLADPTLLGVTSGAACAAALMLTLFSSVHQALPAAWRLWLLPASTFAGALAVCWSLDRMARWLTPGSVAGLLLTGLAVQAITMAVVGLCTYIATDEQLRSLTFWSLGSLAGASWLVVALMAAAIALVAWRSAALARALNALALGEAAAGHVGIDVQRLRGQVIVAVALLSALAVAWCGVIGFIGLMAPHLVRVVVGPDQRRVLPLSMAAGALLLLLADTLARNAARPAEIPVGIFTALLGAPLFLVMLRNASRTQGGV